MGKKISVQQPNLRGINIFKDSLGRVVFYDHLTKSGYLITKKDANLYNLYSKRFVVPIFIFVLIYQSTIGGQTLGLSESIFVCFFAVLFMETLFRMYFLKSLTLIPNFHPNIKEDFITRMTKGAPKGMLTLKASLYFILAILILLLAYTENYDQNLWIVCIIASTAISAVAVIYLIALKRK